MEASALGAYVELGGGWAAAGREDVGRWLGGDLAGRCYDAGVGSLPNVGKQIAEIGVCPARRRLNEDLLDVDPRIDTVTLRRRGHTQEHRGTVQPAVASNLQPIAASHRYAGKTTIAATIDKTWNLCQFGPPKRFERKPRPRTNFPKRLAGSRSYPGEGVP